jgi:[acyl-carrier-protein] S-malonyltransferase
VGARVVKKKDEVRSLLARQICSRVEWEQSMRRLISLGVKRFIEVGPGRILTGLMKKIDKQAVVHYVEDGPSLEKLLQERRKE